MKNLILLISSFCFILISCSDNDPVVEANMKDEVLDLVLTKGINNQVNGQQYSATELIVRYRPTTSPNERAFARANYNVQQYESCKHCDELIEKWTFPGGVDLENKLGEISEGSGGPESVIWQVEKEFGFSSDYIPNVLNGASGIQSYTSKIKANNNGITIAVIDTGIDVNYPTLIGETPFLYNASHLGIGSVNSGWNYATDNHNTYDDYSLVHGTAVATVIKDALNHMGVPFQLMPLKVADRNGKVSKFKLMCAMLFASDKVEVMQISLGWHDIDGSNDLTNDIFLSLLEDIEQEVIVVTSAGNISNNNDTDYPHYPSDYATRNVIAVAALNEARESIASYSNFGPVSVDFASDGTLIPFVNSLDQPVPISGTSFAAPHVAAVAAKFAYLNPTYTPGQIISIMNATGDVLADNTSKPILSGKVIYPY